MTLASVITGLSDDVSALAVSTFDLYCHFYDIISHRVVIGFRLQIALNASSGKTRIPMTETERHPD